MSGGRRLAVITAVLVLAVTVWTALSTTPAAAQEPAPGTVEICSAVGEIPELGGRMCAAFEAGSTVLAGTCQRLGLPPEACGLVEDDPVDPAAVTAYQDSWVHRALRAQELLDRHEPLVNSLVPHTHNSANSTAYPPTLTTLDPNQRYSIGDQLRMDIRGIELDLHWVLDQVVLCHGTSVPVGDFVIHAGCSIDQPLVDGLVEVREFLTAPGNDEVVLLLYLENQLDGDPAAHRAAVADLEEHLGGLVALPPAGPEGDCADAPMDRSRQDVLDAGAQIVIVGNCGPGPWRDWVHDRGPRWDESGFGGSYGPYPDCVDAERTEHDYDADFIRHWEDLTFVSATANGQIHHLEPAVVHEMVRCGVDMIGFDRLEPFDGRLEALIWSWAPGEPDPAAGDCARRSDDGRFHMEDCTTRHRFACRTDAGAWIVPETAGPWSAGDGVCRAADATFAVPPTGWENERLGVVAAAAGEVWLAIGVAAAPAAPPPVAVDTAPSGGRLPATGGPVALPVAALAVLVAVALRRVHVRTSMR